MIEKITKEIADKRATINTLLGHFEKCDNRYVSIPGGANSLLTNDGPENLRKMLNSTMNVLVDQMELNKTLIAILTVIVSDDDWIVRQGKFAMKTGQASANDILSKMMQDKLRGKV